MMGRCRAGDTKNAQPRGRSPHANCAHFCRKAAAQAANFRPKEAHAYSWYSRRGAPVRRLRSGSMEQRSPPEKTHENITVRWRNFAPHFHFNTRIWPGQPCASVKFWKSAGLSCSPTVLPWRFLSPRMPQGSASLFPADVELKKISACANVAVLPLFIREKSGII